MNSSQTDNAPTILSCHKKAILRTLLYFDIFNYPLKMEELHTFAQKKIHNAQFKIALEELVDERLVYQLEGYYLLHDDKTLINRRVKGNLLAEKKLKLAKNIACFIGSFPYVRAVMLSGSISKGYMDKESDIDFFVVTAPGNLWIARTMLILFKRICLFNSHKYFCVNYFVDTENLEIEEQNIFTAMESVTLIPAYSEKYYLDFWRANSWTSLYFPNIKRKSSQFKGISVPLIKNVIEFFISNLFGRRLDIFLMKLTRKRWQTLFKKEFSPSDFEVAFKSKEYASKNHPRFYQKRILDLYEKQLQKFEDKFHVNLTMELS